MGLLERYERTGSEKDLDSSIEIMEKLLRAVPGYSFRTSWLINLGHAVSRRYDIKNIKCDLTRGIELAQEVVAIADQNPVWKSIALSSLGCRMAKRFQRDKSMDDLDQAIRVSEKGLRIAPQPSAMDYLNLARHLFLKTEQPQSVDDLDRAINVMKSAKDPKDTAHSIQAAISNHLGVFHLARFHLTLFTKDHEAAAENLFSALANSYYFPISRRVQAGRFLLELYSSIAH